MITDDQKLVDLLLNIGIEKQDACSQVIHWGILVFSGSILRVKKKCNDEDNWFRFLEDREVGPVTRSVEMLGEEGNYGVRG